MFKVTRTAPDRIAVVLEGQIDSVEMRAGIDTLISASEGMKDGTMLYTITDFKFPKLGAFGVEFTQLPKLFSLLGRFRKCAVLSETGWIRTVAEVEGALIPGLEIKSFEMDEAAAAENWLAAQD